MSGVKPNTLPYAAELARLERYLKALPTSIPSGDAAGQYDFANAEPTAEDVDTYGGGASAANHVLEVKFGSRAQGPVTFKWRGPDLVLAVDLIRRHLTGTEGENKLLLKWVDDLTSAAEVAIKAAGGNLPRDAKPNAARRLLADNATQKDRCDADKKKEKERKATREKKKELTEQGNTGKPLDQLVDVEHAPQDKRKGGKQRDPLLEQLTIKCEERDTGKIRWRCAGKLRSEHGERSCPWNWADPRQSPRVFSHAVKCAGLSEVLKNQVREASSGGSLGAQVEALQVAAEPSAQTPVANPPAAASAQPDVPKDWFGAFKRKGQVRTKEQLKDFHTASNFLALKFICDSGAPVSLIDSKPLRELLNLLDHNHGIFCSTTFSEHYIPYEAARVRKLAFELLGTCYFLTITFDGGSLRRPQSVYTVHVTVWTAHGRVAYFVHGDEASGVSHTGVHIAAVLRAVMQRIGVERFAGICSDNTGNTSLARTLIQEEFPWIFILPDPCHHLSNLIKDICRLPYFEETITQMKAVIKYFSQSTYAATHLNAIRVSLDINKGLESVGKTRFGTNYWAGYSLERCWDAIKLLVTDGTVDVTESSALYFFKSLRTRGEFSILLAQLVHVLEPAARAIKCLESPNVTAGDVWKFYIAIQATVYDLFEIDVEGYPPRVKDAIRGILNTRVDEMLGESQPHSDIYLAVFFLDPEHVASPIFRVDGQKPSASARDPGISDQDLRDTIPVYGRVGLFLLRTLYREYECLVQYPRDVDALRGYKKYEDAAPVLSQQYQSFVRQQAPFNARSPLWSNQDYWHAMLKTPLGCLLAYIVLKANYVMPNAVVEERTMSNFTQINTANRASQRANSVVNMTQIRQHYRRTEAKPQVAKPAELNWRSTSELFQQRKAAKVSPDATPSSLAEIPELDVEEILPVPDNGTAPGLTAEAKDGLDVLEDDDESYVPADTTFAETSSFESEKTCNLKLAYFRDLLSDTPIGGATASDAATEPARSGQKRKYDVVQRYTDIKF